MKKFFTLFVLFLYSVSLSVTTAQNVVYVNQEATGNDDGTSWQDAFTDLGDAIDYLFTTGELAQVWIAKGTYLPGQGNPNENSVFHSPPQGVELYGGFTGNETSPDQRDIPANPTILSGDINNNDEELEFDNYKDDNTLHVIFIDSLTTSSVVIDGLIIKGGHTNDDANEPGYMRRGGGVLAYGEVHVSNTVFEGNFARAGGAFFLGKGTGSTFYNCTFQNNKSSAQSAGIFINTISDITISNCIFSTNLTARGAVYPLNCDNITLDSCYFELNLNETGFGGAFFDWNSTDVTISNSIFYGNAAANGGAIYQDGSELHTAAVLTFDNVIFDSNSASDWGGGSIYNSNGSTVINDCTFKLCSAPNSGGAAVFTGNDMNVTITNTLFDENSVQGWGGAHTCYGENTIFNLTGNTYRENSSPNRGGAINAGFYAVVNIDDCFFDTNTSGDGGAVAMQNDSTVINVSNSTFASNAGTGQSGGGGISGIGSNSLDVSNSNFEGNTGGTGGAVSMNESGDDDIGSLNLTNTVFYFNQAASQGGAVNMIDVDASILSCAFFGNIADGTGTGGAISNNASDSNLVVVEIINTTFADNSGALAGGIAQWTGTTDAEAEMIVQNNIFANDGLTNYAIEDGTPTLISNGGNLSDDNTMEDYLTAAKDLNDTDPLFLDPSNEDYHLLPESPAVDGGIDAGAPEYDIEGNPRVGTVDKGAYESPFSSGTEVILANDGMLTLTPNPAASFTYFKLDNDWKGEISGRIVNVEGKTMNVFSFQKGNGLFVQKIDLQSIPSGAYDLLLSNGSQMVIQKFIRQ